MTQASRRARTYLERMLRAHRRKLQYRLPALPVLARQAGVAQATMAKAVGQLRERGILRVSHGKGICIADSSGELQPQLPQPAVSHGRKWQRLADTIRSGIIRGEIGPGALLPSRKELGVQYGACFTTVRRALNLLTAEKYLLEDPRGFRVAGSRAARSVANTVVLVARGDSFSEPSLLSPRTQDHLRFLETACNRAGLRLEVVTCHYIKTDLQGLEVLSAMLDERATRESLLGFVVWNMGIETSYLARVLGLLAQSGKAVACLDEHGNIGDALPARARRIKVYGMAVSDRAGHAVARYLLARGHRQVAYLSGSLSTTYARERLRGLRREYARAGVAHRIDVVDMDQAAEPLPDDPIGSEQAIINMLLPGYVERTGGRYSVRDRRIVRLAEEVSRAHHQHRNDARFFDALDRLYRRSDTTVWVGATDTEALCAVDLLRLKGVEAPCRVSVMGIDDGYEAFAQQLTSYNFGGPSYMNAMLNYILSASSPARGRPDTRPLELDGFVSERRTVGPGPFA